MYQSEEVYLGGISSADFIVRDFPGNAIHVTNKRLILVRSRFPMVFTMFGSGAIGTERSGRASGSAARTKLSLLEKRKIFEVDKMNIRSIELRKPNKQNWSMLRIAPKSGEPVDIGISSVRDFEYTRDLMTLFYPEAIEFA